MLGDSVDTQQKQMERLKEFVANTMKEINNISQLLNWDPKTLENVEEFCVCPYDSSHRIPKKSLDGHLVSCQWKAEGYRETDLPLSESTGIQSHSSIKFDEQLQAQVLQSSSRMESGVSTESFQCNTWQGLTISFLVFSEDTDNHNANISNLSLQCNARLKSVSLHLDPYFFYCLAERLIPRTSDRLLTDFSSNERRLMYEYAIQHTVKPHLGHDITDGHANQNEQKHEKELSYLELLAQERNMKRRRAKHKSVHTNKKSHTEILREVINQQMEIYLENITDTQDTSTMEPLEQITAETYIAPAEEIEQYSPRIRDNSVHPHPSTLLRNAFQDQGSSRKYETYHQTMSRHGIRPQDHQKYDKYSPHEKYDRKESSRRHSHHEHKRKSRSEYHESAKDTHRSKHKSHKSKSHSSRTREGSSDHYYSHHSRDHREKREKQKHRD